MSTFYDLVQIPSRGNHTREAITNTHEKMDMQTYLYGHAC